MDLSGFPGAEPDRMPGLDFGARISTHCASIEIFNGIQCHPQPARVALTRNSRPWPIPMVYVGQKNSRRVCGSFVDSCCGIPSVEVVHPVIRITISNRHIRTRAPPPTGRGWNRGPYRCEEWSSRVSTVISIGSCVNRDHDWPMNVDETSTGLAERNSSAVRRCAYFRSGPWRTKALPATTMVDILSFVLVLRGAQRAALLRSGDPVTVPAGMERYPSGEALGSKVMMPVHDHFHRLLRCRGSRRKSAPHGTPFSPYGSYQCR